MVKVLAYLQCGPGSNPGVDATCGLNLLLVLSLAPRGFSFFQFPPLLKTNTSKFQLDLERPETFQLPSALWVSKLQIYKKLPFFPYSFSGRKS